ncbi:MAG: penicillin-binding transpeptidase domain-containing protein [Leptospirales bacterium]|nr:penicillin-binding transpeptidase domain-containing protein [Leptospirales bacterium]
MNQKAFRRRIWFTTALVIAISTYTLVRLFSLHFSDRIVAEPPEKREARRGTIKDRNGDLLAMSIVSWSVYANPEEIKNPADAAARLSRPLGLRQAFLVERMERNRKFVWLKRKIDQSSMEEIKNLKIAGIHFRKEYLRVYPHNSLASNIVGFVGLDNTGLEGMEYRYNNILKSDYDFDDKIAYGKNIVLTIDNYIQKKAEDELKKAAESCSAKQGSVIIMNVKTGEILALAKYPGFDPSRYNTFPDINLRNFSVTDSYEPGSTMKVFSMAAAYEYSPELFKNVHDCKGSIQIADTVISCERSHGRVAIDDVISKSCNVGIIETMRVVPRQHLHDFLKRFGFGAKTEAGFPGEAEGILRPVDKWSGLSKYSISIGYELSLTSLQLAAAYSAMANKGIYNAPVIMKQIEGPNGKIIERFNSGRNFRVCSENTAAAMLKLMRGVIIDGTGKRAALEYYHAAGKTGTSRKFSQSRGVYADSLVASFAGIVPVENPALCILVILDTPADGQGGGAVAAPLFAAIAENVLLHLRVKTGFVKAADPLPRKTAKADFDGSTAPDFRKLNMAESLRILKLMENYEIEYELYGSGRVRRQQPEPGQPIQRGGKIALYFE